MLLAVLCAATGLIGCKKSSKSTGPLQPDSGNFAENTYRSEFFRFSYPLPPEWHESNVPRTGLPPGAYYLFIGDWDTHPLKTRVIVMADAGSNYRSALSAQEYISARFRAQVKHGSGEVIREPSPFVVTGTDFYRADYKMPQAGTTVYSSLVCTKRDDYWLNWSFVAPSQKKLDEAVSTLQHISFDQKPSPSQSPH